MFIVFYIIDKKAPIVPDKVDYLKTKESKDVVELEQEVENEVFSAILNEVKEINPLKTYKVWTYIEFTNTNREIYLSSEKMKIPIFFQKCLQVMKKRVPDLIILTPMNIKKYLPDFPIEMGNDSEIPLKKRIDILFAFILETYGGLCISPGTIVINVDQMLSMIKKYKLITVGASPDIIQSYNNLSYPNTYVIGSQKKTPIIMEYRRHLMLSIKNKLLHNDISMDNSYEILSYLISLMKPQQFHFGTEFDGSYNNYMQMIDVGTYLEKQKINFLNEEKLSVITVPYNLLMERSEYKWFLNLSKGQYETSNFAVDSYMEI
ncbi:MAG: hypothetical protein CMG46_02865 [Candidatus Marinimicrobia bacterium]|nr:hypothetical protein [Candidatus Neomarinimicrobiota bacterium]